MALRAHVIISGRVQGVCYRAVTKEQADCLKLSGWIRNLPSGQVEAVFEGEKETIENILSWCRKGPPGARVANVVVTWEPVREEFDDFRIVH